VVRFLVALDQFQDAGRIRVAADRQLQAVQDLDEPLPDVRILQDGSHAHRHAFAVQVPGHVIVAFVGVAEGMAEVQQPALPAFPLIRFDDPLLDFQRTPDDLIEMRRIVLLFKQGEQCRICDQAGLDGFRQAVVHLPVRQALQRIRINQHRPGLPEGADVVFEAGEVNRGLAADAGIDLRQRSRRNVEEADAALVD